jgi:methylmalonyl-CoA/ethylmalonyl-CoA epimerase
VTSRTEEADVQDVPTYGISQVGMVVADLETSMRRYHEMFGWGPWKIYEYKAPFLTGLKLRGEPASFTWIGADARAGDTWIELLQPLGGDNPLSEWLAAHGDGVHHLGYEVPDVETAQRLHRSFEQQGLSELLSAFCGGMYFYFMDAAPLVIEVWAGSAEALTPARTYP